MTVVPRAGAGLEAKAPLRPVTTAKDPSMPAVPMSQSVRRPKRSTWRAAAVAQKRFQSESPPLMRAICLGRVMPIKARIGAR